MQLRSLPLQVIRSSPQAALSSLPLCSPESGSVLLDLDGDGLTNLAEFLANTLPNNRNSRFVIISAGFDSGSFAITWNSVTNRRYRVWTATSMTGPWTALTAPLTGVSGTMSYTHSSPGGGVGRFYRVEAML